MTWFISGDDLVQLKEMNEKLRAESSQREGILVMRLTGKEQEVQDLLVSRFFITFLGIANIFFYLRYM